jgi:hypothetical protein
MFTPIRSLPQEVQADLLASLGVTEAWEATWDIGLTDFGDSYAIAPMWGRRPVDGRWPAAFPKPKHTGAYPWRTVWHTNFGHVHPNGHPVREWSP